jgi:hypothetical protein
MVESRWSPLAQSRSMSPPWPGDLIRLRHHQANVCLWDARGQIDAIRGCILLGLTA